MNNKDRNIPATLFTISIVCVCVSLLFLLLKATREDARAYPYSLLLIPFLIAVASAWWGVSLLNKSKEETVREARPQEKPATNILDQDREAIIRKTYAEIDKHLRKASIAQLEDIPRPDDPAFSWFGKVAVAAKGETWPVYNGKYLLPLLQVRIKDLPYIPAKLQNAALVTVFMDPDELPFDNPPNGQGFLVRAYKTLEELSPITQPELDSPIKPFPIRWTLAEDEGPNWEDAWSLLDLSEFNKLEDEIDLFYNRYHNTEKTKIGGWPSLIQHELPDIGEFVFQIGTEEKAGWIWGDNGIGYFLLDERGEWHLTWQCY